MLECRIMALGGDWPQSGPGWRLVAETAGGGADVALLPADSPPDAARLDRLALPLIVAVRDLPPLPASLDRADAFLLPGDDAVMIGALAQRLVAGSAPGVADTTAASQQISALSAEARRIADALAQLAQAAEAEPPEPVSAPLIRRLIRLRRDRDRHFPAELFADPAWDMLLDLAAARMERVDVPVSSLCVAAAVPTTTALRWVRSLSEAGLFVRRTDPGDARRAFITLSDQAFDGVTGWLRRFSAAFQMR
jgi:hypothetical protein